MSDEGRWLMLAATDAYSASVGDWRTVRSGILGGKEERRRQSSSLSGDLSSRCC